MRHRPASPPPSDPADAAAQAALAARLATLPVQAPARLEARIAELTRPARRRRRPVMVRPLGALAAAAAVLVLAVVWLGSAASPATPSVSALARFALSAATGPAPAPDPAHPALLRERVGDVPFPRWGAAVGFSAIGQRAARLAGRRVVAVAYRSPSGVLVGYSIAAAPPLPAPGGTTRVVAGQRVSVGRAGAATTITWRRDGHTCVIAAEGLAPGTLIALALGGYQRY